MTRSALITGITGQDGSYLAELLLSKDYQVHGVVRRSSRERMERLEKILPQITLHEGDLTDSGSILRILQKSDPVEVYNLAAQSFVPSSWTQPILTSDVTGLGVTRMLEVLRQHNQIGRASCRERV